MSSSINQVTLLGRLGTDPQMKVINGTAQLCLLSVATDSDYKDKNGNPQKDTQWHKVAVWGAQARPCCQFLHKGDKVCVTGSIKYSEYEQNGLKQKSAEIVAREVVFLGQRSQTDSNEQRSAPPQNQQPQPGWGQPVQQQNQQPQNNNSWGQPQSGWGQPVQQQNQQPQNNNGWGQPQPGWGQMEDVPF